MTLTVSPDFERIRTSAVYRTFGAFAAIACSIAEQIASAPPDSGGSFSPLTTRQGRSCGAVIAGAQAATRTVDARTPPRILLHMPSAVSRQWLTVSDPFVKFRRYLND